MTDKILTDKQGNVVVEGDSIMYITDGPRINYGIIKKIEWTKSPWGYEHWKIRVLKTYGFFLNKPMIVILTEPTMFKCGVELVRIDKV